MDNQDTFYNDGFGWVCRQCENDFKRSQQITETRHSKIFSEGEAEKNTGPSNILLARWTDKTRRFLTCPNCGLTEPAEKS